MKLLGNIKEGGEVGSWSARVATDNRLEELHRYDELQHNSIK